MIALKGEEKKENAKAFHLLSFLLIVLLLI